MGISGIAPEVSIFFTLSPSSKLMTKMPGDWHLPSIPPTISLSARNN